MRLELDFEKSIEENASLYFEQSKKAKRKLAGLEKAMERTANAMERKAGNGKRKPEKPAKKQPGQWFRPFHWFFSSGGFLVVGGKSAKDNEQLVKKHFDDGDFFLHADIPGGAAVIIKAPGKEIPESTFVEAAQFAAACSRAWKQGLASVDVYAVAKGQVSKSAPSGTSLATGAFMIYGKRKWFRKTPLAFAVGLEKGSEQVISGPPDAIKKNSLCFIEISQGNLSRGAAAKGIISIFRAKCAPKSEIPLDEVARALPGENIGLKAG